MGDSTCGVCNGFGYVEIDQCPRDCLGQSFTEAIKLALYSKHHLPIGGGLCDQSFWFLELIHRVEYEQSLIEEAHYRKAVGK